MTVDLFGDSVARCNLYGGDFHRAHSAIHTTFRAMLRRSGFATTTEPANIFHGKVPGSLLAAYLRLHSRKDAIIPYILAHDFPADANGSGARCMEAIFDIKTLRVDRTAHYYRDQPPDAAHHYRATDRKLATVRRDYQRRAEKLDITCTRDDGSHHFADALRTRFQSGGVHPIVFGAFGESNRQTGLLVRLCAQFAAACTENADFSPLHSSMRRGTARHVLLKLFRRSLGCTGVRVAAEAKLRRVQFIRSSRSAANAAARPVDCSRFSSNQFSAWHEPFQEFHAYHTQYSNFHTDAED